MRLNGRLRNAYLIMYLSEDAISVLWACNLDKEERVRRSI